MKHRPMFTRFCGQTEPHAGHGYVKRWRKIDLPLLPEPHRYPASWNSRYQCPGVRRVGKTWAESLGLIIPDDAPGGQRIERRYQSGGRRQPNNRSQIDYEGFFDNDAYRRDPDA